MRELTQRPILQTHFNFFSKVCRDRVKLRAWNKLWMLTELQQQEEVNVEANANSLCILD